MGNKNFLLILGLVFSTLLSGKVYAGNVEDTCAQNTNGYYHGIMPTTANTAIIQSYKLCVSEGYRMQEEQANAPAHPGNAPVYDCDGLFENKDKCRAEYEGNKAKYEADLAKYQEYMSSHGDMYTAKTLSAAQVIEDIAAKQQKSADRLNTIAQILKVLGGAMVAVGTMLVGSIFPATVAVGVGLLIAGAALLVFGIVVQGKSNKIAREKVTTCEQLNKILTKPMSCDDVKEQTPIDGTFTPTNYGFDGTGGTSEIPPFIDPTTGKCKAPVTPECATLVKNSPKDCFKANAKGVSCLASVTKPAVTTLANGKVSMNVNGKQRSFGAEDFADEASMVKAGFTSAQAKQFLAMTNDPNSILAKNGLSPKGELRAAAMVIPSISLGKPSAASDAGGTGGTAGMKSTKDEYGPAQAVEVARVPASAEGLTKDYNGEKIGAEGDDVFKMINRRYILKQKQNIFLDQ
jgi:hypothetical protein